MDKSAKFWDKIAKKYAKQPVVDEAVYKEKLRITREYIKPDMEVLEIGCGTGSTAIVHAPYVNHIRAIDISPNMIEIAQAKADLGNIKNVSFEVSTIDKLEVADQSMNMVLALSILHLVESRDSVIANVYKMLKPGGVFVTSTVCLGNKMKFFKLIAPIGKWLGFMPLLKVFRTEELKNSLVSAGFEIDHYWHPEKHMAVFIIAKKAVL